MVGATLLGMVVVASSSPAPAAAAKPANPCLDAQMAAQLLCPDLVMSRPFGLRLDALVRPGRLVLRAGDSIDNVGLGPAELFGVRTGEYVMRGRQRIYRRVGAPIGVPTGAHLVFKFIPGQGRYWKFRHAARFELWRRDSLGQPVRRVRTGPKVTYCLRDLAHSHPGRPRSPTRFVYPACNRSGATRRVRLGTSVGWSDVYGPGYPEQWIDVTGLRGCFDYRQIADPLNGIYESNESNNSASVTVRLPYRRGRQHCPRRPPPAPVPPDPLPPVPPGTVETTPGY